MTEQLKPVDTDNPSKAPDLMKAVQFSEFGPPEVLRVVEVERPTPSVGEVRVRVRGSFVAFGRDVSVRNGKHPFLPRLVQLPHILGGEHAGVVDAVGPGGNADLVGKRVAVSASVSCTQCVACQESQPWDCEAVTAIGIQRPGSNAEYTVVPEANLSELPENLAFGQAAAFAASGPLAWEELSVAQTSPNQWVLVPGASGSVGMMLVALAVRRGANVVACTRGARAKNELLALGAVAVLDSSDPALEAKLRELSPRGVDVVVDNIADVAMWSRYWPALARRGRIVLAGQAGNSGQPLPIDVVAFYNRRATVTGLTIGDPRPVAGFWADLRSSPLEIPDSFLRAFPLEKAADAHRLVEGGGKVGHVVLAVD
jgi:NADPH:quinone reductase-like Zn-dependent oxidoreductase